MTFELKTQVKITFRCQLVPSSGWHLHEILSKTKGTKCYFHLILSDELAFIYLLIQLKSNKCWWIGNAQFIFLKKKTIDG